MVGKDFSNLTGKILIASPYAMEGNIFHQSLIYVVHHSTDGAVGFIVNRTINNNTHISTLFKKNDPSINLSLLNLEIHIGGPLELERGFFLHSAEYDKNLLFKLEKSDLAVSSNLEILKDITNNAGPKLNMFAIGYTGWSTGQIELEIQNNLWIVAEPDTNLIFGTDANSKWFTALANLGIDSSDFVPYLANC